MITDDQGAQILKRMDDGFKKVDKRLKSLEMAVAQHDNKFKNLATRDDLTNLATRDDLTNLATRDDLTNLENNFNAFKEENLKAHENMAASLEELGQEFASFTRAHDRLEEKVNTHEETLIKHKLLIRKAA